MGYRFQLRFLLLAQISVCRVAVPSMPNQTSEKDRYRHDYITAYRFVSRREEHHCTFGNSNRCSTCERHRMPESAIGTTVPSVSNAADRLKLKF
jgi:predicted metal-binding protein